jgi:hypothetical protein
MTNAQKQRGPSWLSGDMACVQLCVSLDARGQPERLSWHDGYGITYLIAELPATAGRTVEASYLARRSPAYRVGGCEGDRQVTA